MSQPLPKVLFYGVAAREPILASIETDWESVEIPREVDVNDLPALIENAVALVASPFGEAEKRVIQAVLQACKDSVKLFQITMTGTNTVDWSAVPESCAVCNVFGMETGIAEFVLTAMLQWNSRVCERMATFRKHWSSWVPPWTPGSPFATQRPELASQTLGIVGLGTIGLAVVHRARAFNMRIVAVRSQAQPPPEGVAWVRSTNDGLEALLAESDFVLLCCDLNDSTRGLIDARRLSQMKSSAVVINVARGPVIVEGDLYAACQHKSIGGAVLDVWWTYPEADAPPVEPSRFPFHELDNVIVSPHCSGWTACFRERRVKSVASNLDSLARGEGFANIVRRPQSPM
eukprot:TRINITY_DN62611_c0_g1_i1.p1 TRINITY_DN62611_c0_g1~~TRINITY_DN62611_c0_g1_i1.p1  ORF type:complete len:346 (-),score=46.61 TRINITY_DN62611_c0_g1_i1:75-1112(-)